MAFHAILITRDEDDIIAESLKGFLSWADEVHVFDTGSVDHTWDIVNEMALNDKRIRPVEKRNIWFSDHVRGYCFDRVRDRFCHGDWFLRVDSDEIYHITPPEFVSGHLQPEETCVYQQYYDFRITLSEAEALSSPEAIAFDRRNPIEYRRNFYTLGDYPEPRMARYRRHMIWPCNYTWPVNAGFLARKRLPVRHYPNRDPQQLLKRVKLRHSMINSTFNNSLFARKHHWRVEDWRSHLVDPTDSNVFHWAPGQNLPLFLDTSHLPSSGKRYVQYFAHQFIVPLIDPLRFNKRGICKPIEIDPQTQAQLEDTLLQVNNLP